MPTINPTYNGVKLAWELDFKDDVNPAPEFRTSLLPIRSDVIDLIDIISEHIPKDRMLLVIRDNNFELCFFNRSDYMTYLLLQSEIPQSLRS